MDDVTGRLMEILASREYGEAAGTVDILMKKVAMSNRFQVDAALGEAESFFSKIRDEKPEIYQILAIREKEAREIALRIKAGKRIVLD